MYICNKDFIDSTHVVGSSTEGYFYSAHISVIILSITYLHETLMKKYFLKI